MNLPAGRWPLAPGYKFFMNVARIDLASRQLPACDELFGFELTAERLPSAGSGPELVQGSRVEASSL